MVETSTKKMYVIDVTKIEFTKRAGGNARKDFSDIEEMEQSILANGITEPIRAYRNKQKAGYWLATNGERRLIASKNLIAKGKVKVITCVVNPIDENKLSDEEILYTQFLANSGKQLNDIEQADLVKRLLGLNQTVKQISKQIGKSEQYVYQMQRLSNTSSKMQKMILNNEISRTMFDKILTENSGNIEAAEKKIFSLYTEAKAITAVATDRVNELFGKTEEDIDEEERQVPAVKKITTKDLKQKNSFKEAKAAIKEIDKKNLTIKNKEVYELLKGISNNEYEKAYLIALIGL